MIKVKTLGLFNYDILDYSKKIIEEALLIQKKTLADAKLINLCICSYDMSTEMVKMNPSFRAKLDINIYGQEYTHVIFINKISYKKFESWQTIEMYPVNKLGQSQYENWYDLLEDIYDSEMVDKFYNEYGIIEDYDNFDDDYCDMDNMRPDNSPINDYDE